ncbi:hypothetical protein B0H13DRAFT_2346543 [Mycena leptocephala]|nr:hypothetical protein B0H13DRAFT_2346543 [Mycena leptocephala]
MATLMGPPMAISASYWSECQNEDIQAFFDANWGNDSSLPQEQTPRISQGERANYLALHECLHDSFPTHYAVPDPDRDVVSPIHSLPRHHVPVNLARASCNLVEFAEHKRLLAHIDEKRKEVLEKDGYLIALFGSKGIGKSCSLYYLLIKELQRKRAVIFSRGYMAYYFSSEGVFEAYQETYKGAGLAWRMTYQVSQVAKIVPVVPMVVPNMLVLVDATDDGNEPPSGMWFTAPFFTVFATTTQAKAVALLKHAKLYVMNPPSAMEIHAAFLQRSARTKILALADLVSRFGPSLGTIFPMLDFIDISLEIKQVLSAIIASLNDCNVDLLVKIASNANPPMSDVMKLPSTVKTVFRGKEFCDAQLEFSSRWQKEIFFQVDAYAAEEGGRRKAPTKKKTPKNTPTPAATPVEDPKKKEEFDTWILDNTSSLALKTRPPLPGSTSARSSDSSVMALSQSRDPSMSPTKEFAWSISDRSSSPVVALDTQSRDQSAPPTRKRGADDDSSSRPLKRIKTEEDASPLFDLPPCKGHEFYFPATLMAVDEGMLYIPFNTMNPLFDAFIFWKSVLFVFQAFTRRGDGRHNMATTGIPHVEKIVQLCEKHDKAQSEVQVVFVAIVPLGNEASSSRQRTRFATNGNTTALSSIFREPTTGRAARKANLSGEGHP